MGRKGGRVEGCFSYVVYIVVFKLQRPECVCPCKEGEMDRAEGAGH